MAAMLAFVCCVLVALLLGRATRALERRSSEAGFIANVLLRPLALVLIIGFINVLFQADDVATRMLCLKCIACVATYFGCSF